MHQVTEIYPGQVWIHTRNNEPYLIKEKIMIKVHGQWSDGILYENSLGSKTYARTEEDFLEHFHPQQGA